MMTTLLRLLAITALLALGVGPNQGCSESGAIENAGVRGTPTLPLRVMLVPADGGTEQGTIDDFEPVFLAVTASHGLYFDIKVGQSYNSVIEAMAARQVDVAFFGAVSYAAAREKDAAELLAVSVTDGESVYYSGLFARADAGIDSMNDLRGRSIALGDVNSTSSFNFPVAMILEAGIDPADDLGQIVLAGSHASALVAAASGRVDVAGASFLSYEKAIRNGTIDAEVLVPIARSRPIPNPPLAMHPDLPEEVRLSLREAFETVHESDTLQPGMLRGYGGKAVDRYNTEYSDEEFDRTMSRLAVVTEDIKSAILRKAGGG